ncbi:MAG: hypothetical protein ACOC8R_01965 [Desulfosalsimonas sp.]
MKNSSRPPSVDDLRRRRQRALQKADNAIAGRPAEYREIKRLLDEVLSGPVDVADYHRVAGEIVRLLEKLSASSSESLFAYYCNNIDPGRQGDTRYFKVICRDLRQQLKLIDQYRRQSRRIRIMD